MRPVRPLPRISALQQVVLVLVPHGGQRTARRNSWAGMSAAAVVARNRREATVAVRRAEQRCAARLRRIAR